MFYHSTFKLMFRFAICVLKGTENVGNSKEEYITSYVLNARLQTTEKPSWETKKILYKQPLATDPKSLIPSWFSLLFNPSYFLLPNSICFSLLLYSPTIQTILKHSEYIYQVSRSFSSLLSLCVLPAHLNTVWTWTHMPELQGVEFFYGSSCAHIWLAEPDTENNEKVGMTNSVCRIPACSWD